MAVKSSSGRGVNYTVIAFALVLVVIGVGGFFGYQRYDNLRKENERLSNPQEAAKTDIENTKEEVGKLIVLPDDEEPTVANVVDKTKLEGQEFFKNAENGDKLLLYQNNKKAILYRPSIGKIVEVSTVSTDNISGSSADAKATTDAKKSTTTTDKKTTEPGISDANQEGLEP